MSDRLAPADVIESALRVILPPTAFRDSAAYLTEPRGRWAGQGLVVAAR